MLQLEKARQVNWDSDRIKPLQDNFLVEGYYEPKGSFIFSKEALGFPSQDVSEDLQASWDDVWKQLDEDFESEIAGTCSSDLSGKMLYTWDGNHRLSAWTGVLKLCKSIYSNEFASNEWNLKKVNVCAAPAYQKDVYLHPRVRVQTVYVTHENEMDMLSIVMRINKYLLIVWVY